MWQRCDSNVHISVHISNVRISDVHINVKVVASDSAVAALSVAIAVTLMCTALWQQFKWQCWDNDVFAATALSLFSLSQRCACFRCHSAVLVFAVTALCTSVSNRGRIPPVYTNSYWMRIKTRLKGFQIKTDFWNEFEVVWGFKAQAL